MADFIAAAKEAVARGLVLEVTVDAGSRFGVPDREVFHRISAGVRAGVDTSAAIARMLRRAADLRSVEFHLAHLQAQGLLGRNGDTYRLIEGGGS